MARCRLDSALHLWGGRRPTGRLVEVHHHQANRMSRERNPYRRQSAQVLVRSFSCSLVGAIIVPMISTLIAFVVLMNAVRTNPVVPDLELSHRAQARAAGLCASHQWSHDGWKDSFKGLKYKYAGENLAKD